MYYIYIYIYICIYVYTHFVRRGFPERRCGRSLGTRAAGLSS